MTRVVVAEKPSVARDLARVLGASARRDGFLEGAGYRVTWAIGHLVALAQPHEIDGAWKRWRLDALPMIPETWPLVALSRTRSQLTVVKRLLNARDTEAVICATDAGREGELIFRYIYEHAGCTKPVQRLWISSLTPDAIRAGFARLRPGASYDNLAAAARARSQADWLVGMNLSRAHTLVGRARERDAAPVRKPTPARGRSRRRRRAAADVRSVGRVQTPTLSLLVDRELAIREFVPEDYLEVQATFRPRGRTVATAAEDGDAAPADAGVYAGTYFDPALDPNRDRTPRGSTAPDTASATEEDADKRPDTRLPADGEQAGAIVDRALRGVAEIERVERKRNSMPPPRLYDLTELQRHANRLFGLSAKQTLDAAQTLYEKHKLISYPRTDSRHLSSEVAGQLAAVTDAIAARYAALGDGVVAPATGARALGRRYVDDARVTDHHAIIPTSKSPKKLDETSPEGKIYDLVCRRLLSAWHEDHVYATSTVITKVTFPPPPAPGAEAPDVEPFVDRYRSRGREVVREGWKVLDLQPARGRRRRQGQEARPTALPTGLAAGLAADVLDARAVEKQTRPPPRFTESTLLTAMETAGRALEDRELSDAMREKGLGTPATRAATIETLLDRRYIERQGKSLHATDRGVQLIAEVHEHVKSPAMTGTWEYRLKQIERGQGTLAAFMTEIEAFVRTLVREVVGDDSGAGIENAAHPRSKPNAPSTDATRRSASASSASTAPSGRGPRTGSSAASSARASTTSSMSGSPRTGRSTASSARASTTSPTDGSPRTGSSAASSARASTTSPTGGSPRTGGSSNMSPEPDPEPRTADMAAPSRPRVSRGRPVSDQQTSLFPDLGLAPASRGARRSIRVAPRPSVSSNRRANATGRASPNGAVNGPRSAVDTSKGDRASARPPSDDRAPARAASRPDPRPPSDDRPGRPSAEPERARATNAPAPPDDWGVDFLDDAQGDLPELPDDFFDRRPPPEELLDAPPADRFDHAHDPGDASEPAWQEAPPTRQRREAPPRPRADVAGPAVAAPAPDSAPIRTHRAPTPPEELGALLRAAFRFDRFRPHQEAVCRSVTAGEHVLLVMPTGAGKSLCYQLPGLARAGTTLVVSPLIALMEDQVGKLRALGLAADRIHSGRERGAGSQVYRDYLAGRLDYLFVAPERLGVSGFVDMLARRRPTLIAIDEAHCISQWGHDFRPDYRMLGERLPQLQPTPIIALTATATPMVQRDIIHQLGIERVQTFIHGFRRDNIAVEVVEISTNERGALARKLLEAPGRLPAIVYAPTRKQAESLPLELGASVRAASYHAGMEASHRDDVQARFLAGELDVIVATIAFGMGIDKPDVRTVLHMALPGSVEGYYQEIGRAGRDGAMSRAIMMHSYADHRTHEYFTERDYPEPAELFDVFEQLSRRPRSRESLARALRIDREVLDRRLQKLWVHGGARLAGDDAVVRGHTGWEGSYIAQRNHKQAQLMHIARYAESASCRMLALVRHFGDQEDSGEPCGHCDVCAPDRCLARRSRASREDERRSVARILELLREQDRRPVGKLFREHFEDLGRRAFESLLAGMARARHVTLRDESFQKNGRTISYRRVALTSGGRALAETDTAPDASAYDITITETALAGKPKRRRSTSRASKGGKNGSGAASSRASMADASAAAPALTEALSEWRKAMAKRLGIPAYRVLTNKTLAGVVSVKPRDRAMLSEIKGVGPKLLENYADDILQIVRDH